MATTLNLLMKTLTTTCAPLEKIHGLDFKGTWQGEHQIIAHTSPACSCC